jgi:hypothetical protein
VDSHAVVAIVSGVAGYLLGWRTGVRRFRKRYGVPLSTMIEAAAWRASRSKGRDA